METPHKLDLFVICFGVYILYFHRPPSQSQLLGKKKIKGQNSAKEKEEKVQHEQMMFRNHQEEEGN